MGNVYLTGWSYDAGGLTHYLTIKYDPGGNLRWAARYAGPENLDDRPFAIGVDDSGAVFVTGRSGGEGTQANYATVKYDRTGRQLWAREYDGPAHSTDGASALAVDKSGNVYVTGSSMGSTGPDFATIKYDPDGNECWVRRYQNGWAQALALDSVGNLSVTGNTARYDIVTIRYDAAGHQSWVKTYDGPDHLNDWAWDIKTDRNNYIYVTGTSYSTVTGADYVTLQYDTLGSERWVRRYEGPRDDKPSGLAIDTAGNIYVTGTSDNDFATVKYDTGGQEIWVERYNGPGNSTDLASAIAADRSGSVYVTGASFAPTTNLDYCTIKYGRPPIGVSECHPEPPPAILYRRGARAVELTFTLARTGAVKILLFDPAGREAAPPFVRSLTQGFHRLSLPLPAGAGVFFLRIAIAGEPEKIYKIVRL